ncbi:hypothetical protein CRUP_012158 [Coryphaenoides rupestris]|nr:hypothetical protein CRUP_012158 [Coryphaenoides rupestris]
MFRAKAWERLERAEHERERVLREELIRQRASWSRREEVPTGKGAMRETWLQENQRLVAQTLVAISAELDGERYHDAKRVGVRKDNVLRLWDYLQELLKARRGRLGKNLTLQRIFQEDAATSIAGWTTPACWVPGSSGTPVEWKGPAAEARPGGRHVALQADARPEPNASALPSPTETVSDNTS